MAFQRKKSYRLLRDFRSDFQEKPGKCGSVTFLLFQWVLPKSNANLSVEICPLQPSILGMRLEKTFHPRGHPGFATGQVRMNVSRTCVMHAVEISEVSQAVRSSQRLMKTNGC